MDPYGPQDRRIEDFKTELKNKDEEYIKMLKQQRLDITTLISKMREQYHSLRQQYEQQLEDIEQAFEEERKEMLQKNKARYIFVVGWWWMIPITWDIHGI